MRPRPESLMYKKYVIGHNFYGKGEYTVLYNGDELWFDTLEEAKKFIEEIREEWT